MSDNSHSASPGFGMIHPGAFVRALIPPLMLWGAVVVLGTVGGQPGVACLTPLAWLLALWSGTQYALHTAGLPLKRPLPGAALLGALLGVGMAVLFIYGSNAMLAGETRPEEFAKSRNLNIAISLGSIIFCSALSTLTAWLTRRRLAQNR